MIVFRINKPIPPAPEIKTQSFEFQFCLEENKPYYARLPESDVPIRLDEAFENILPGLRKSQVDVSDQGCNLLGGGSNAKPGASELEIDSFVFYLNGRILDGKFDELAIKNQQLHPGSVVYFHQRETVPVFLNADHLSDVKIVPP